MQWYQFLLLMLAILQTMGVIFGVIRVLYHRAGSVHVVAVVLMALFISLFAWSFSW